MPFVLEPFQLDAVHRLKKGCILNGGTGSGKSLTGLSYYYLQNGGSEEYLLGGEYTPMKNPRDLYIITTAQKRDKLEWQGELIHFYMYTDPEYSMYQNKVIVDSWNNISKYRKVHGAFFLFDEDRVKGNGEWVKSFLDITRKNDWIILSATPGDKWTDYIPVFVANGFFKNKTQFNREHVIFSPYVKYPKVQRYFGMKKLQKLRNQILVNMDFARKTVQHHIDVPCEYDQYLYKSTLKNRWDPFNKKPFKDAAGLYYGLRKIVNSDVSRENALLGLLKVHNKVIVFYNFDYELDILREALKRKDMPFTEYNGHKHEPIPETDRWVYLVNYMAGAEGWNCTETDAMIFYSQNYSYSTTIQAAGRIDRLNTPFTDLYYYHFKSKASIDLMIARALKEKRDFNESKYYSKLF